MAYSKEGLLGDFSGQLGHFIVYKVHDKTVIRSRPVSRRGPVSPALKAAQTDFGQVMNVLRRVKTFVRLGFYDVAQGRSAFHQALSENLLRYRASAATESLDWLLLSRGGRANALDVVCSLGEKQVEVAWGEPQGGKPWEAHDQVMLLAVNTTTLAMAWELSAGRRADGTAKVWLPPATADEQVRVYISFRSALPTPGGKDPFNMSDSLVAI